MDLQWEAVRSTNHIRASPNALRKCTILGWYGAPIESMQSMADQQRLCDGDHGRLQHYVHVVSDPGAWGTKTPAHPRIKTCRRGVFLGPVHLCLFLF